MSYRQIFNLLASHSNSSTMWEIEIRHDELGKYRHIKGKDKRIVEQKANAQMHVWIRCGQKRWQWKNEKRKSVCTKIKRRKKTTCCFAKQIRRKKHKDIENTLTSALSSDKVFDSDDLIDNKSFSAPKAKSAPGTRTPRRATAIRCKICN